MKKIILLCATVLCSILADAQSFEVNGIRYDVTAADEVTAVGSSQPLTGFVSLPATVNYSGWNYKLTAIADDAFRNSSHLSSMSLPEGLRNIGASAFSNSGMLRILSLPTSLESIGRAAFYGCSALENVTLPASVTTIGDEAFVRCTSLKAFQVDASNPAYSSVGGVLLDKDQHHLIAYPNQRGSSYIVPSTVTDIDSWAFLGCNELKSITMTQGVQTIGYAAFYGCSALSTVSLPNSVTTIGVWAFSECEKLVSITLGSGVTTIEQGAFSFCPKLLTINVSTANSHYSSVDGVLLDKAQEVLVVCPGGKSGSYRIPSTVKTIATQAFYGCNALQSVTLTSSLSEVTDNPFIFCDELKEILVSYDNNEFTSNNGVLLNKAETDIVAYPNAKSGVYTVPDGIESLHCGTFLRNGMLTNVTIPASTTSIGDWTFMDCEALQSVSLPASLQYIGERAFECPSLETVICLGNPMETSAFITPNEATLYMPKGNEYAFYQTEGWTGFGTYTPFGLQIADQKVSKGTDHRITISTTGPFRLSKIEADIKLPPIMDLKTNGVQGYQVELAQGMKGSLTCTKVDDHYHLELTATDQRQLGGDDDALIYLETTCQADARTGVYDLMLQSVGFTFANDQHTGEATQPDQIASVDVIESTGISSVVAGDLPQGPVYNLQGQLVRQAGESPKGLPVGLYIVNGKKTLIVR